MQNLIKNAQWFSQSNGKILYFTNRGNITYDKFCMDNHRFCSLTMQQGTASNHYDIKIPLQHVHTIRYGYHMRAIVLDNAWIKATFYDANDKEIGTCEKVITPYVDSEFHDVCAAFSIIPHAQSITLSLHFSGDVTACTFGMPFLELYGQYENADENDWF